jgi:Fe-S-cluster containining protein
MTRAYSETDVALIHKHTGETEDEIEAKLGQLHCGYLRNNTCSIHLFKPDVCRWWPGPGANCPGYQKLVEKYWSKEAMHRICNTPELTLLFIKCLMHNDREAALEILKRLEIEI